MENINLKEGKNFIFLGEINKEKGSFVANLREDLVKECVRNNSLMFLVDLDGIYDEFEDSSNLKFKICKNSDDINALADYLSKLDLKERSYLFITDYNKIVNSNEKLMNVINSKKDNLRVVVFCKEPLKLKSEDVSSFDYAMHLDFNEVYDGLFNEPLKDYSGYGGFYPAIYDVKNIGIYNKDERSDLFSEPLTNPFALFDLIFSEGKIFNFDCDIERFTPGLKIDYSNIIFYTRFAEGKSLNTLFDEMIDEYDVYIYFTNNHCLDYIQMFLLLDEERLCKFFDFYYDNVIGVYECIKYSNSFRESMDALYQLDYSLSILCSKYYYSTGNIDKGDMMLFLALYNYTAQLTPCALALLHANDIVFNQEEFSKLNSFKEHLNSIKDWIYPDWVCMCPRITYFIGKYYLYLNDKKEAESWFTLGSNLDYEDRYISLPFNEVSRNQYEKLLLKLEAKKYSSCRKILRTRPLSCFRPLPIESKLIPDRIDQNDIEKVEDYKFKCYSNFNPSFKENGVYLGFQYLDEDQKKEFEEILNKKISKTKDKKELEKLEWLKHRLTDEDDLLID